MDINEIIEVNWVELAKQLPHESNTLIGDFFAAFAEESLTLYFNFWHKIVQERMTEEQKSMMVKIFTGE